MNEQAEVETQETEGVRVSQQTERLVQGLRKWMDDSRLLAKPLRAGWVRKVQVQIVVEEQAPRIPGVQHLRIERLTYKLPPETSLRASPFLSTK